MELLTRVCRVIATSIIFFGEVTIALLYSQPAQLYLSWFKRYWSEYKHFFSCVCVCLHVTGTKFCCLEKTSHIDHQLFLSHRNNGVGRVSGTSFGAGTMSKTNSWPLMFSSCSPKTNLLVFSPKKRPIDQSMQPSVTDSPCTSRFTCAVWLCPAT